MLSPGESDSRGVAAMRGRGATAGAVGAGSCAMGSVTQPWIAAIPATPATPTMTAATMIACWDLGDIRAS